MGTVPSDFAVSIWVGVDRNEPNDVAGDVMRTSYDLSTDPFGPVETGSKFKVPPDMETVV